MDNENKTDLNLKDQLNRIENLLISQKKAMTFEDVISYTGFKASYLYKLTSSFSIPYSKPRGGKLFFDKDEIDAWLLESNRIPTKEQLEQEASDYILNRR